ncbi:Acetyltransferase (GNAT) family protein [Pilibacter termitis]|uniref:Acetyltransferase (GNAT) family protein n=1 Tax=Pilibacter termitis TaxID=263852 RepID=A0A1T4MSN9_9ENTE|nr:GNAT family N-acetyltransferase [Pilibacter termitis]SJZ69921.1 Acetyltransferase (GNAT) family protein [Pilibacter termitis]
MIRQAKKADVAKLAELMLIIFQDMELPLLAKIGKEKLKNLLLQTFQEEEYRYSYTNALVAELDGEVVGVVYCYNPQSEKVNDSAFEQQLSGQYNLQEQLFFQTEVLPDEWYLDSIALFSKARGKGLGTKLLLAALEKAKEKGAVNVGLNVEQNNQRARELYENLGFVEVAEVEIVGHKYGHLQKRLFD